MSLGGDIEVTIVNHLDTRIDCAPSSAWNHILKEYRDGGKFHKAGYSVMPLEGDPGAYLGGYRIAYGPEQEDERICRITEFDKDALRMSMRADYISPAAKGMVIQASYHILPLEGHVGYTIDSYAMMKIATPDEDSGQTVGDIVATITAQFDEALSAYLLETKSILEKGGSSGSG